MNILHKLKETAVSVLPVMAIVLILGLTVVPLPVTVLVRFLTGGILLTAGLTIFLLGVDLGIQPMGERCGAELTKKRNLFLLLASAFVIGFVVTAAEPDIQVFGDQVRNSFPAVNKLVLTFVIAAGVGIFITVGLLRTVTGLSLKWTLFIVYVIVFAAAFFARPSFIGIGFDSGGATTGPMTVPFIMALGLGVSSVRAGKNDNSFGLTGIASAGPVLAVIVYSFFLKNNVSGGLAEQVQEAAANGFGSVIGSVFHESLVSIAPLFGLFIIFQIFLLRMTARQVVRMIIGFAYSFIGLSVFLTGVYGGFMQAGQLLGETLGHYAFARGGWWLLLLVFTGLAVGAIIVCAEPAVWSLSEQVEHVSGGTIKRKMLLAFLSTGTAIAIGLAMLRAVTGFDLKWILIPGYALAMILMPFCPDLFTGIAFDSGGVASGPLTSTFVLSFTIGAAGGAGGGAGTGNDSFGVIALVAMMPLIAIQIMGIVYKLKTSAKKQEPEQVSAGGGDNV